MATEASVTFRIKVCTKFVLTAQPAKTRRAVAKKIVVTNCAAATKTICLRAGIRINARR